MEQKPKVDDYLLFLAVADAGGLAGAEKATGTPSPTLSRRMVELERRLGKRLFERGARGYTLTAEGRALASEAIPLRDAARRIDFFTSETRHTHVRITTGHWTARRIAQNISKVRAPDANWMPELMVFNAMVDIARREADIGIRNRRPDQNWLAGRKLSNVTYAEFAASPNIRGYITMPEDLATSPSQLWLRRQKGDEIVATASNSRTEADLALSGLGRLVMPVFAGRTYEGLVQVSGILDDLTHEEWIVSHQDARHDPPVRAAIDALTELLTAPDPSRH